MAFFLWHSVQSDEGYKVLVIAVSLRLLYQFESLLCNAQRQYQWNWFIYGQAAYLYYILPLTYMQFMV